MYTFDYSPYLRRKFYGSDEEWQKLIDEKRCPSATCKDRTCEDKAIADPKDVEDVEEKDWVLASKGQRPEAGGRRQECALRSGGKVKKVGSRGLL